MVLIVAVEKQTGNIRGTKKRLDHVKSKINT
jgi:hypothetical protein